MRTDVTTALLKKAEQVQRGAELLMSKTRDWQTIKAYLSNRLSDIELTPEQQEKLKRYQFIYNQLVSGKYTDQEVISQVIKTHSVKIGQAYEDMSCTREIFNSVVNINKRFEINLQLQINRSMLNKCQELGDMKSYAQLEKNREKLLALLPDEEENPADFFEGHQIEAVFDPRLLGAPEVDMKAVLEEINKKRSVKIRTDLFEELTPEDEKPDAETTPLQ